MRGQAFSAGHYYQPLPTENLVMSAAPAAAPPSMVSAMQQGAMSRDEPGWDNGGLFGCCSNGRGFLGGCERMCFATCCMPCAQYQVGQLVARVKNKGDSSAARKEGVLFAASALIGAATENNLDNILGVYAIAERLQSDFKEKITPCNMVLYSLFCSTCFLTWTWNTAEKLDDKERFK